MKTTDDLHTFLNAAAGEGLELDGVDAANLYASVFPERYKAATQPTASPEQDNYDSIWNALHRIDSAAAMLPTYTVDHEGGIEAFTQNIVDAITRLAQPTASNAGERQTMEQALKALEWHAGRYDEFNMPEDTVSAIDALRAALASKPPQPVRPESVLKTLMTLNAYRAGLHGLCQGPEPETLEDALEHLRARLRGKPPAGEQITHVIGIDLKTGEDKIVRLKVPLYTAPQPEQVAQNDRLLRDAYDHLRFAWRFQNERAPGTTNYGLESTLRALADRFGEQPSPWWKAQPEQVAQDKEDAENYRWLCTHMIVPAPSLWDNGVGFLTPAFPRKRGSMTKAELDDAIHAARARGEGGAKG